MHKKNPYVFIGVESQRHDGSNLSLLLFDQGGSDHWINIRKMSKTLNYNQHRRQTENTKKKFPKQNRNNNQTDFHPGKKDRKKIKEPDIRQT